MSGLVLLVATWNCWISYKNGYAEMLVLYVLPPLALRRNIARLSLFYRYYFDTCPSAELAEVVPLPYS